MIKLTFIALLVLAINIPFGYWRTNVKRYSLQWFLAIHIPVPLIIALRIASGIGFAWYTYVFLVSAFFLGQQLGSLIIKNVGNRCDQISSCLVMDVYRCIRDWPSSMIFILSTILITLALVFYSLGVWAERIARLLKPWHVITFWTGFTFDVSGTALMWILPC